MPDEEVQVQAEEAQVVEDSVRAEPEPSTESAPESSEADWTSRQKSQIRSMLQMRDQQWQQHQAQQVQASTEPVAPENTDETGSDMRALYTDDDVGQRTFETVNRHFDMRMKDGDFIPRSEAAQMSQAAAQQVQDRLQSGANITSEVESLVASGVIQPTEARSVQQAYSAKLRDPGMSQAASSPANAAYILKSIVYDMVKNKEIRPFTRPAQPTSPLTSSPGSPARAEESVSLDPSKSPFKSVRQMTPERFKEIQTQSNGTYMKANGGGR